MPVRRRRGFIILVLTVTVLILSLTGVLVFYSAAFTEYRSAVLQSNREKALLLAESGLEAARMLLIRVPEEQLYQFGIMYAPPVIPLGGGILSFRITEETGKLNVNRLVYFINDDMSLRNREMLNTLAESFSLPADMWDPVVDYIDANNVAEPKGYEQLDYAMLNPPRTIKNNRLHSLEELLLIPGFDHQLLFEDLRTEAEKEEVSEDFLTDEEALVTSDEDFILANNLTVYLPENPGATDPVNINSAPYHVILSISEYMTVEAAEAIIMARLSNGGRFSSVDQLSSIPELQIRTSGTATLFDELKGRITTADQLYKIVAEASLESHTAQIIGIYDKKARKLVRYME